MIVENTLRGVQHEWHDMTLWCSLFRWFLKIWRILNNDVNVEHFGVRRECLKCSMCFVFETWFWNFEDTSRELIDLIVLTC